MFLARQFHQVLESHPTIRASVLALFAAAFFWFAWGGTPEFNRDISDADAPLFSRHQYTIHEVQYLQRIPRTGANAKQLEAQDLASLNGVSDSSCVTPAYYVFTTFWEQDPVTQEEEVVGDPQPVSAQQQGNDPNAQCSVVQAPENTAGGSSSSNFTARTCNPQPPVVSAKTIGGDETVDRQQCSAFADTVRGSPNAPSCSAKPLMDGKSVSCSTVDNEDNSDFHCSAGTLQGGNHAENTKCSVATRPRAPGNPNNTDGHSPCSAKKMEKSHSNNGFCSAWIENESDMEHNRICSVTIVNSGDNTCSIKDFIVAGDPVPGNVICSTLGRSSSGTEPGQGNVSCSAGSGATGNPKCSVINVTREAICSTFAGQHQNCSSGANVGGGSNNTASCSTFGLADTSTQFCSATVEPPPGKKCNNKCSALTGDYPSPNPFHCSVIFPVQGGKQFCSVFRISGDDSIGGHTDAACTVIVENGQTNQNVPKCSAIINGEESDQSEQVTCSAIDLVAGNHRPPENRVCGKVTHSHGDPDGNGIPGDQR